MKNFPLVHIFDSCGAFEKSSAICYTMCMTTQKTVLVAEDDSAIMMALKTKCEKIGLNVKTCSNGVECLNILNSDQVDCLLLDLLMPEKDGFEVLAGKRDSKNKDIPTFVLTNLGGQDDALRAKELGATEYFVKSMTPLKDVIEHVEKALQ